jgi:hypothetical protein
VSLLFFEFMCGTCFEMKNPGFNFIERRPFCCSLAEVLPNLYFACPPVQATLYFENETNRADRCSYQ